MGVAWRSIAVRHAGLASPLLALAAPLALCPAVIYPSICLPTYSPPSCSDTYYIAHVKDACAFLGDGMSRISQLEEQASCSCCLGVCVVACGLGWGRGHSIDGASGLLGRWRGDLAISPAQLLTRSQLLAGGGTSVQPRTMAGALALTPA